MRDADLSYDFIRHIEEKFVFRKRDRKGMRLSQQMEEKRTG